MTHFYFASTPLDDRALYYVYMYAPAFLFPFVVGFLPANALEGGVLAIYLAFADDPLVLESTEPNLYMDMLDAWQVAMEDVQMAADEMRPEPVHGHAGRVAGGHGGRADGGGRDEARGPGGGVGGQHEQVERRGEVGTGRDGRSSSCPTSACASGAAS